MTVGEIREVSQPSARAWIEKRRERSICRLVLQGPGRPTESKGQRICICPGNLSQELGKIRTYKPDATGRNAGL